MTLTSSLCLVELIDPAAGPIRITHPVTATSTLVTIYLVLKDVTAASGTTYTPVLTSLHEPHNQFVTLIYNFYRSDDKFFQLFFSYLFFHL